MQRPLVSPPPLTTTQAAIVIRAMKERLRYIRQAARRVGHLTPELQEKRIETIAIIQSLGGTWNDKSN